MFGVLVIWRVVDAADVAVGDVLATSGLGLRYPEGYPVGIVIKIRKRTGQQFSEIVVSPTAHLYRDTQVLLLWHSRAKLMKEASEELENMKQENKDMNQQIIDRVRDGG